jgi:hypothetical protein
VLVNCEVEINKPSPHLSELGRRRWPVLGQTDFDAQMIPLIQQGL